MEDRKTKREKVLVKVFAILFVLIALVGVSYALFQVTLYGTKKTKIGAANMSLKLTDANGYAETEGYAIDLDNTYPMYDADGMKGTTYEFHLVNEGSIGAIYQLYLDDVALEQGEEQIADSYLRYSLEVNSDPIKIGSLEDLGINPNRNLTAGTIKKDETIIFKLHLWIDINADNSVMGKTFSGKIRVEGTQYRGHSNPNILAVYHYRESGTTTDNGNETYTYTVGENDCITGDEAACQVDECYKSYLQGTCSPGTIVKYQVNDDTYKYFYVLHDDGKSMTLQQRENTVESTAWYPSDNIRNGPLLSKLDATTDEWINVNTISYTLGETQFIKTKNELTNNPYTGCYDSGTAVICNRNIYTLERNNVRSRLITVQEAYELGCRYGEVNSCPIWLFNYLGKSKQYGGSVNMDRRDGGYWTVNALYNTPPDYAFLIYTTGGIRKTNAHNYGNQYMNYRAVVEIDK